MRGEQVRCLGVARDGEHNAEHVKATGHNVGQTGVRGAIIEGCSTERKGASYPEKTQDS